MCLSFIGYEGSERRVRLERRLAGEIVRRHGGICIGSGPGTLYDQKKFDTPYIRDFLLDWGVPADVSETAAPWSGLLSLYRAVGRRGEGCLRRARRARLPDVSPVSQLPRGRVPVLHLRAESDHRAAMRWPNTTSSSRRSSRPSSTTARRFLTITPLAIEHARWLAQDISAPGLAMLTALFEGIDPGEHLNPGKIVPAGD